MTKSKITAAIAALTFAIALTVSGGQAQAHPHHFHRYGFGLFAASALIGAAAVSSVYAEPAYSDCHYVRRYDRWGHPYVITVCNED